MAEVESKKQNVEQKEDANSSYEEEFKQMKSIFDNTNLYSDWMLSYLNPILKLGSQKPLTSKDLGPPGKDMIAEGTYSKVKVEWEKEKQHVDIENEKRRKKAERDQNSSTKNTVDSGSDDQATKSAPVKFSRATPSVPMVLLRSFGVWKFSLSIIYYVISAFTTFIPVLLLNDLVKYFESNQAGREVQLLFGMNPWVEVVLLGVVPLVTTLLQARNASIMTQFAVFVRTALATLLYEKSLKISASGRAKTDTGQVVNMMSNDTSQIQRFLQFSGFFLVAPLQIILCLVLIFQQVGHSMWVGLAFMILLAPANGFMFAKLGKLRRKVLKYSDARVKLMNEVLSGIRIIKFYAWERPFGKEIDRVRRKEVKMLTHVAYVSTIGFSVLLMSTPVILPILVFSTYVRVQDDVITASKAFTTVALFNIMRFPFAFLPMGFLQYIQANISVKRLGRYFELPELEDYVVSDAPPGAEPGSQETQVGSVSFRNASFGWVNPDIEIESVQGSKPLSKKQRKEKKKLEENTDTESANSELNKTTILENITCTIEPGKLVAVVGEVGSGKSSFLAAILGEMEAVNDSKVYVPRADKSENFSAFCTQSPWVVNDTVKGNIVFGREFDEKRYNEVIEGCALLDDLKILPAGDMTEIGERGINLSGGQKARVCLARALYSPETKLLLMDDPLSAVDSHVGDHLFEHAITGEISRGRTRILVTHHVHFLPGCDYVIVLEEGRIKHQGKYFDLISQGVEFKGAIEEHTGDHEDEHEAIEEEAENTTEKRPRAGSVGEEKKKLKMAEKGKKLTTDEDREEGQVGRASYIRYGKAGGLWMYLFVLIAQGLNRGFEIGASFWLAYWSTQAVVAMASGESLSAEENSWYLGIFATFGAASILSLALRGLFLAQHRLYASRNLHDALAKSILHAPVAFFDVTPLGRVLNRFAYDIERVDNELTNSSSQALSTTFSVLGSLGAIIASTKGIFCVPLIPLGYVYYIIQRWFRKSSTELQRVTSITGSPIFADFSLTLSGTPTIRSFGMRERFFNDCKKNFDVHNTSYMLTQLVGQWLGLRLDIIGGFIASFVAAVSVGTSGFNFIPAAWLGIGLAFSIEITGYLKHGVRILAQVEADLTSVERVLAYSNDVPQEAPDEIPDKDPKEGTWPSKGEISVSHMSMRYRDGPLVLKDLSVNIRGGEKIGVVGRTGSGKSSLMIALFRITELEPDGGKIVIDGHDTSEIGTIALRSNISIIPQDPVLFSSTLRYNLDPFETATDAELWDALEKVKLHSFVKGLEKGLLEEVAEGGENFSQGQKQLLCIARSILRKPKILIMDEATASIDNSTDYLIQKMIRENFANATILTIAHRLNTIMDSDRILVLDEGHVAEFDTPKKLMANRRGAFYGMVEKSRNARSSIIVES